MIEDEIMARLENLNFGRKPGTAILSNRMNSILLTIKDCINEKRLVPSLMLIYSSIDVLGSIGNRNGYATRGSFKKWVTDYLFKAKMFPFSEDELYGARCSIVHTMRYDSKDTNLRIIVYGFHGHDICIKKITDPTNCPFAEKSG